MTSLIACMILAATPIADLPELTAHRGESHDAPENTLAAFDLAWKRKLPSVELDVHLTRDGQLVICHDADTQRTAGVKKIIKDCTYEELRDLDVGSWKDPKFASERMPLLVDALRTIPDGSRCFIEVKVGKESVPPLVEAIKACGKSPEQLTIISFKEDTVAEAKRLLPKHKAYFLASFKKNEETGEWSPSIESLIEKAGKLKADGLDLSWKGPWDAAMVQKIRAANLELYCWTVDDPEVARRMIQLGVDGITTNRGEFIRQQLTTVAQ